MALVRRSSVEAVQLKSPREDAEHPPVLSQPLAEKLTHPAPLDVRAACFGEVALVSRAVRARGEVEHVKIQPTLGSEILEALPGISSSHSSCSGLPKRARKLPLRTMPTPARRAEPTDQEAVAPAALRMAAFSHP